MEAEKTRKKVHRLSESEKNELISYIQANEKDHTYSNNELAEMFEISLSTITYYKALVKKNDNTKVSVKEKEDVSKNNKGIIKIENNDATPYITEFDKKFGLDEFANKMTHYKHRSACIEAGLINNRHDIPVKNYIFNESLSQELMFDYDEQERIVQNFIDKHCMVKKKLILYTTGLQSALSSVIKVCLKNDIDLSIKHYNASSKSYILQELSGTFEDITDPFFDLAQSKNGLFFYKCTQKELENSEDTFYVIKFTDLDGLECEMKRTKEGHIIVKNFDDIFDILPTMVKSLIYYFNQRLAIYVNKCYIKDGTFRFGFCFSKNYSSNSAKGYNMSK